MREIIGGCGQSYNCGQSYGCGALQSVQPPSGGTYWTMGQSSYLTSTSGATTGYTTTNQNEINTIYSNFIESYYSGGSPTDCVFQSMAYLAGLYGNSNLNLNSMQNNYNSLYSGAISAGIIPLASGGVDAYLLPSFVDQYFNRAGGVTTIAQLNSFIAAGGSNFAIGTYTTGTGTSHAVVITGMTSDGTQYICTDSQNNIVGLTLDINRFTGFVAITGGCP
ncbi:hypothetical protein FNW25_08235 [Flavobacterium franklandianum]|uniref:hypothetical protein n=1 Tax=Flavobacterium franklandianum TaxID=2594430 RepID=UPI00117A1D06|nr:hypothetical protein [Flavobacterium franklandianum]TRX26600.1 hypothetical protein FNW25_08235 [Flavobacterium franklandianum]